MDNAMDSTPPRHNATRPPVCPGAPRRRRSAFSLAGTFDAAIGRYYAHLREHHGTRWTLWANAARRDHIAAMHDCLAALDALPRDTEAAARVRAILPAMSATFQGTSSRELQMLRALLRASLINPHA